jgi:hypothetical protein
VGTLFWGRNKDRLPESFQLKALPLAGLFIAFLFIASPFYYLFAVELSYFWLSNFRVFIAFLSAC